MSRPVTNTTEVNGNNSASRVAAGLPARPATRRRLLHIPIIHTHADLGSLAQAVRALTARKHGDDARRKIASVIDELWDTVEQAIETLSLPHRSVRLYQDALPVCGRELAIATDLAQGGSRNHQLLLRLVERGATLMGTEAPELLIEEYQLTRCLLAGAEIQAADRHRLTELSQSILERRDRAIAARIDETLGAGETGILFVGMLHAVTPLLPADIRVEHPVAVPDRLRPARS